MTRLHIFGIVLPLAACVSDQTKQQEEQLLALGGYPEQQVVFYRCWDARTQAGPRASPRRQNEHCYVKQPAGFAVLRWDSRGTLQRVERSWDFGQDTTAATRRRWATIRDSLVTRVSSSGFLATPCRVSADTTAWFGLWAWRMRDVDVLVLAVADGGSLAVSVTASAERLTPCWSAERPAA